MNGDKPIQRYVKILAKLNAQILEIRDALVMETLLHEGMNATKKLAFLRRNQ